MYSREIYYDYNIKRKILQEFLGKLLIVFCKNVRNDINSAEAPEFVYETLARSLLPVIQKYYESGEDKRAFAE